MKIYEHEISKLEDTEENKTKSRSNAQTYELICWHDLTTNGKKVVKMFVKKILTIKFSKMFSKIEDRPQWQLMKLTEKWVCYKNEKKLKQKRIEDIQHEIFN